MATEGLKIEEEYAGQRPIYEALTENAFELLKDLLTDAGIEIASMEKRTKTVESLKGKIERGDKAGKYATLQEVTDLSGIRIVSFLKEDCKKISEILRDSFLVDSNNSLDKEDEIDADRFGYQSIHLILSYSEDRLKLPEFKRYAGLKFEVQIKTLLQHTWSAIDWKLRYKRRSEAPRRLRRRLFRISALLDAADDELSYVYEQVSDIKSYYANAIAQGDLSLDMDRDSIDALLTNRASANGPISAMISKLKPVPSTNQEEKYLNASEEKFLPTLKLAGISDLKKLDERIKGFKDDKLAIFQAGVNGWMSESNFTSWSTNKFDIARAMVILSSNVDTAAKILNSVPFNPVLTSKIKQELGIEESKPKAEPTAAA